MMYSDGGTLRREFLELSAAGGIGVLLSQTQAVTAQSDHPVNIECSEVQIGGGDRRVQQARIDYRDGSFVRLENGAQREVYSPGRIVQTVTYRYHDSDEAHTVRNPNTDCDPGELQIDFDYDTVTFGIDSFSRLRPPWKGYGSAKLFFADGTSQRVSQWADEQIGPPYLQSTLRSTGEHEGKLIEAVAIHHGERYMTHFLRNRHVDARLLGTGSSQERFIEVVATTDGELHYELTVRGSVSRFQVTEQVAAGDNDTITDNGDEIQTVQGFTGNTGYGDAYRIQGELVEITQTGGDADYVVRELSRRVLRDGTGASHSFAIVADEEGEVSYEFTVDGPVYKRTQIGNPERTEDNDSLTTNNDGTHTVSGFTGNQGYGDTYGIGGPVTDFERTGGNAAFTLYLDSQAITPQELREGLSDRLSLRLRHNIY